MSRILKSTALGFLIFLFFCLMSGIDFIVHGILYNYGLHFSYEWALGYWVTYNLSFVAFSIAVSFSYWAGSSKTVKDLKLSIALIITVNALFLGCLQDIMFFVFWTGGFPPNNIVCGGLHGRMLCGHGQV